MAQGGSIRYTIGFDIDRKGLESLQKDLVKLQTMTSNDLIAKGFKADSPELKQAIVQMNKAKEAASAIGSALQKSFNTKLNTVNISTFQKEIIKTHGSVENLFNELNAMGGEFQQFSTKLASSLLTTNSTLQKTETIIDKMGRSFINTLGWSISSGIVHKITGTIQQAVGYVEHLDTSLNDIRIVTKKSSDEMGEFAKQANNAAKALGKSTTDYTEAALIYYQQGLSDEETAARAETTLKVANVTGQSTAAVSEELTAVWNGYKVSAEEAELYVDKLSAVAATTASDLQELSTGMSKVASAAANMGVDVDQLNAQLATIVSVTRQAPESVGTALKTIYARMTDLQAGGTDEDDIDLGKVSGGLANLGINILDETGDLRELGDVIEEVADSWENWTSAQQAAVAQLIAGKRQYNNIVALFDNWDMYETAIETSRNSMGELQKQQNIYMESTHAHLEELKAQSEDLYDSLLNADTINSVADGLTKILSVITEIVDSLGGGAGVLMQLTGLFGTLFSDKLASGLSNIIDRIGNNKSFQEQLDAQMQLAASLQKTEGSTKALGETYAIWGKYASFMTNEQIQQNKNITEQVGLALSRKDALAEEEKIAEKELEVLAEQKQEYQNTLDTIDQIKQDELDAIDEAHKASQAKIEEEKDNKIKAADEVLAHDLENIEKEKQVYLKENAEKAQTEKEEAARRVKEIESNLAFNEGYEPGRNGTIRKKRKEDISQDFSSADLVQDWNGENSKVGEIKKDLQGIIQLSDQANSHINNFLKTAIPARTELKNGSFTVDQNEWDKWSEKGIKAINIAKQELSQLKDIGAITSEEYEEYTNQLNNFITEEGKISKNKDAKELQNLFETIQEKAKGTGEELKRILEILKQSAEKADDLTDKQNKDIEKKRKEAKEAAKEAKKAAEREAETKTGKDTNAQTKEKADLVKEIDDTVEETNKKLDEANRKEKENAETIKDAKRAQESISDSIKAQNEQLEEQNKKYQRQAGIEGVLKAGTTMVSAANFSRSMQELGKFMTDETNTEGLVGGLTRIGAGLTNGIQLAGNFKDTLLKLSKSNIPGINKLASSIVGLGSKLNLVIGLATAAISIYNLVQGAAQEAREELAREANERVEAQTIVIEEAKKEKDAIDDLADQYTTILQQREENGYLSKDQEDQIYQLIKAFGDEQLLVQALAGDYDKLTESIKGAQEEKNKAYYEEASLGVSTEEEALIANIRANAEKSERGYDDEHYTLIDANKQHGFEEDFAELIGKSGEDIIDSSGNIKYEDLIAFLELDAASIQKFLKTYDDGRTEAIHQIRLLVGQNNQAIKSITGKKEFITDYDRQAPAQEVLDQFKNGINNAQDYSKARNQIAQALGIEEGDKEGELWIDNFITGAVEGAKKYQSSSDIYDLIFGDSKGISEKTKTEFSEKIAGFSDMQLGAIGENATYIQLMLENGKSVDEVLSSINAQIEDATLKDHTILIDTAINSSSAKKVDEAIDELFTDEEIEIKLGISKESFKLLDKGTQQMLLLNLQTQEQLEMEKIYAEKSESISKENNDLDTKIGEAKKRLTELLELKEDASQEEIDEELNKRENAATIEPLQNFEKIFNENPGETYEYDTGITGTYDQWEEEFKEGYQKLLDAQKEAIQELKDSGVTEIKGTEKEISDAIDEAYLNLTDNQQKALQAYSSFKNAEQGIFDNNDWQLFDQELYYMGEIQQKYEETNPEIQEQIEYIDELSSQKQSEIDNNTDWAASVETARTALSNYNKSLDDLQKSYQQLTSIVEDYNDDGFLTFDNLQALIEMDDSYVASLELENGQLSLNQATYDALYQSKLKQLEVGATELYIDELKAIAAEENVAANNALQQSNAATADSIALVTQAANVGVEALLQLADAKAAYEKNATRTEEATKAYYNRMQMIKNLASQGTGALAKTKTSKGSTKQPKEEKYLEREEDIYRQINKELEQIESTLGRIQKLEDHSWGVSAKVNLEEENKLLEKQIEKLHEKKALQERDLSTRRKQLEDVGISFTEDGSAMTNAEAQLNALYAHYNTMVDTYNAMSAAEQETYKAQLEAEKDRINKIEDKISQYESTYSDYQSVLDEIMDKHFEQIENTVKQFNHDIEIHLELDETRDEWNDFWYDIVKDVEDTDFGGQIAKSIDKLKLLVGGFGADVSKSTIAQLTGHLNETIIQVHAQIASASRGGADSMFGDDTALSKETLENYMKALMDKLKEAKAEVDNIGENYLKTLDSAQEKIDKQVEAFESINSHLEHNAKLIQMLSGENSFEALNNMYDQQYDNNIRLVETQRANKEFWEQQIASEKAMMESAEKGSKDYKIHAEALKKASENYSKAINDFDSSIEKTIEDLNKWKDNQLAAINDTFDKALSNGYGLDMVEKEWKLINDQANRYLDNVERALGMESLNNEFNKVLNTTNMSIKAQQELNQMRDEEIAKLNKKVQISQFDLDEVKARLEIRKQEIALEDAQRNKSNLRLRRDSQGNYSYQYTGDDSQIEEASEGLMSAKQAWYELVKKRNIELADAVLENRKNLHKELQDLETMYFESDEEKRKKQLEIIQRYEDIEKDIMKDAEDAKQIFFKGTADFFADVEDASILPQWDSTIEKMISSWSSGGKESFTGAVAAGIEQIDSVQTEYVRRTNELLDKAGVDYQNLKNNGIDPTTNSLEEMTSSNEELADSLEEVNRLLEENAEKLKEAEECYNDLKEAAVDAIKEAQQMIEELSQTVIRSNQQVQASLQTAQNAASIIGNSTYRPSGDGGGSGGGSGSGSGTGSGNRIISEPWKLSAYDDRGFMLTGYPKTYTNKESMKREAKSLAARYAIALTGNGKVLTLNPKTDSQQIREYKINMFKSGGYTGTWQGSNKLDELMSGKLALLHQKELVLNETDTKNLLKAVELLRNISIEKIANSILNAAKTSANILTNVNTGTAQSLANSVTNEVANNYKNMTVNADFSGVRSADAIYEALRNLENVSMQGSF